MIIEKKYDNKNINQYIKSKTSGTNIQNILVLIWQEKSPMNNIDHKNAVNNTRNQRMAHLLTDKRRDTE